MARKLIRKYIPKPHQIQNNRWLAFFGKYIANPNLWHLHRRSVAKAFSIGLFITFIPLPGHILQPGKAQPCPLPQLTAMFLYQRLDLMPILIAVHHSPMASH